MIKDSTIYQISELVQSKIQNIQIAESTRKALQLYAEKQADVRLKAVYPESYERFTKAIEELNEKRSFE